jgi:hypothetical protein
MITEPIKHMLENLPYVFVATTDQSGQPHIAIGEQTSISGASLLIFENWFCPTTLQNINFNRRVSVVAVTPDSRTGYQLLGSVVRSADTAILDGYSPSLTTPDTPQVLTRFTVKVDKILEFTCGIHSDIPIVE